MQRELGTPELKSFREFSEKVNIWGIYPSEIITEKLVIISCNPLKTPKIQTLVVLRDFLYRSIIVDVIMRKEMDSFSILETPFRRNKNGKKNNQNVRR